MMTGGEVNPEFRQHVMLLPCGLSKSVFYFQRPSCVRISMYHLQLQFLTFGAHDDIQFKQRNWSLTTQLLRRPLVVHCAQQVPSSPHMWGLVPSTPHTRGHHGVHNGFRALAELEEGNLRCPKEKSIVVNIIFCVFPHCRAWLMFPHFDVSTLQKTRFPHYEHCS